MRQAWTIGIVNYKSSVYLPWQLRILYEGNPPHSFRLVIVDNSDPSEVDDLETIVAGYRSRFGNIDLIQHTSSEISASGQHGEAINLITQMILSPFVLLQDPDFFWVQPNYLKTFEDRLTRGSVAVGAPYPEKVGVGNPRFPSAFGCAYRTSEISDLDFSANVDAEKVTESFARWPQKDGYGFSFDVGWKVREALSSRPFDVFEQEIPVGLNNAIGDHTFQNISRRYIFEGRVIAYHLFRGTFTGMWTEAYADPELKISELWKKARDRYGEYFYNLFLQAQ